MTKLAPAVALALVFALTGCDPQKGDWGFGAIDTMPTPKDDPSLTCGVALPADALASKRQGCAFGAGALPETTLGISPEVAAQIPIRHVIVLMKENRSFDHIFGALPGEEIPASYTNPDEAGHPVAPFHQTNSCFPQDPGHQSRHVLAGVDRGKMDGFVKSAASSTGTDGHFVMGHYTASELPFYYWLAQSYALSDRHFAPVESGTFANRDYFLFGTNAGAVDTGIVFPPPNSPSLMQRLIQAKFTWGAYTDGSPLSGTVDWAAGDPGVHTLQDFYAALKNGTLPNVSFVDGKDYIEDEHPDADLQVGEAWTRNIYERAVASPEWNRLVIFWTYDEAGGFADHVRPPAACPAEPGTPFVRRGPRIPLIAISPWARRAYVSHDPTDHTAITRFIELLFHLPALSARDANSDALLDLFDFSCGRDLSVGPAPAAGTGACTNPAPPGSHGG